jgi:hypothetical protein
VAVSIAGPLGGRCPTGASIKEGGGSDNGVTI